jgi:hypothetical protein
MNCSPLETLSLVIGFVSAAKIFTEKRNHDIPVLLWVVHFVLCLLIGPPVPICSPQSNLLIVVVFGIFAILLLDAKAPYSLPILQIITLIFCFVWLFLTLGWNKIIYTQNGFWVFISTYILYFIIPICVGIKFFLVLKYKQFPALDIAFVLTADYILLLTFDGFISKIL